MGYLTPGEYKIELWGAGSGFPERTYGSFGAYVRGTISLTSPSVFYVYLGQHGTTSADLTYNGGTPGNVNVYGATSGGGASDIRLDPGAWNSFESLKSRIMVAGAGGGCLSHGGGAITGNGGGIKGEDGVFTINEECLKDVCNNEIKGNCYNIVPSGGNQTHGGIDSLSTQSTAKFGIGGYPTYGYRNMPGGSGYYGGGGGISSNCIISCGAGGSSFVSGMTGCNAIDKSSSGFDNIVHSNQPVHYSGYHFTDIVMLNGRDPKIPQPENLIFYDGACQITILSDFVSFLRTCRSSFISSRTFFLSLLVFIET